MHLLYVFAIYYPVVCIVLADPHKKAIYDTTGIKGLETDGWEVLNFFSFFLIIIFTRNEVELLDVIVMGFLLFVMLL